MKLFKIIIYILKEKIIHFGEIYRLISFHYFINKTLLDNNKINVLDVGFNKGVYRKYFRDLDGCYKYSGVEIDKKYLNKYSNTFFHNFENEKLDKKFDIVFCSHVLEHVKNDYNFLLNMTNSIEEGGTVIIRVPKPTKKRIYFRTFNKNSGIHDEHFRDGYTLKDLKLLFSKVGIKIDAYYYSLGGLGLFVHTIFEILRDKQIRFQRILQLPYIIISLVDIYLIKSNKTSDLLVFASKI